MAPKWLTQTPIAHRGLHHDNGVIPENSLAAFKGAIVEGYPIELDIQVTAGGQVIVFHDSDLERMCGLKKAIRDLGDEEIKGFFLKGGTEQIPLLTDVFKLVAGKVPLLIEIKSLNGVKNAKIAILQLIRNYPGEIAIQSFDPFILYWFAKHIPIIARGQLAASFTGERVPFLAKVVLKNLWLNSLSRPDFIAYNVADLPLKKVSYLRSKGFPVLGWTVRSELTQTQISPYCDNIIFEGYKPLS